MIQMNDVTMIYENGDVKTAVARLSAITEAFPDNDAAHYYLALCYTLPDNIFKEDGVYRIKT